MCSFALPRRVRARIIPVARPSSTFARQVSLLSKRNKLIVGGAVALILVAYLVWSSFAGASQANRPVKELVRNQERYVGQPVRVTGKVVKGSIEKDGQTVTFKIVGEGAELPVRYEGGIPNSFQDNAEVIADGELQKDGVFLARSLLVRCPSKYAADNKGKTGAKN